MRKAFVISGLAIFMTLLQLPSAFGCSSFFDIKCQLGDKFEYLNALGRLAPASPQTGSDEITIDRIDLLPVRQYLTAEEIPPSGAGAYGIVAFQAKSTATSRDKMLMVCESFVAFFPKNELIPSSIPVSDRMITVWPLDDPISEQAKSDDCDFLIDHYELVASETAMADARRQKAKFDGQGPFLIGWSPSNSRGKKDKLVLVVDLSADNTQQNINLEFLFWKTMIVQNPAAWRGGFSLEQLRTSIHNFADQYGSEVVATIKIFGTTGHQD